ncbi:MAG: threonine dehydratase [Alphaproteobacteria bacterium]
MTFSLEALEDAARVVHATVAPTPALAWPLLARRTGTTVIVKHENHTPTGAFKVRGGLVYMAELAAGRTRPVGVIAATRGNHGQSIAFAAAAHGFAAVIVVPHGNALSKNRAMRALGAELIETGHDFQAALEASRAIAAERGLHFVDSFHPALVKGVASYALELFRAAPDLDAVYVPIGLGSGICGVIAARDALGLKTDVVGVVAENAPSYALSFAKGAPVATNSANTLADGMACRVPVAEAVAMINKGAARIVTVGEEAMLEAMAAYFDDTHTIAEGAGAAPLAALLKERDAIAGKRVGLILSGGNLDRALYARALAVPTAAT